MMNMNLSYQTSFKYSWSTPTNMTVYPLSGLNTCVDLSVRASNLAQFVDLDIEGAQKLAGVNRGREG